MRCFQLVAIWGLRKYLSPFKADTVIVKEKLRNGFT